MYNHAPQNYICPLCLAIKGVENNDTMMKQDDIFYRDELIIAAINSKFVGRNPGHVIIFPLKHYENIYNLPEKEASQIMKLAKEVAIALKKIRHCDGIMLQQNNEPVSGQHAFHYHLHVFPRFTNDQLTENMLRVRISTAEERKEFSLPLMKYFSDFKR